jgi:exopolyphosphatase/guanosine-5'-triphosphate,3'-diphosphate pyrophosphatase
MTPSVRRAVVDIGTNSVKLLVADVTGRTVHPASETSRQTRLGQGFYPNHRLQPGNISLTAQAVADFARTARELGAVSIRVIATSAAREAGNAADLVDAIHGQSGLRVEVISGEREAEWAFLGVTSDPSLARVPLLILDVGGGSTEIILGEGDRIILRESFRIGTVRMLERRGMSPLASRATSVGSVARFDPGACPLFQPTTSIDRNRRNNKHPCADAKGTARLRSRTD